MDVGSPFSHPAAVLGPCWGPGRALGCRLTPGHVDSAVHPARRTPVPASMPHSSRPAPPGGRQPRDHLALNPFSLDVHLARPTSTRTTNRRTPSTRRPAGKSPVLLTVSPGPAQDRLPPAQLLSLRVCTQPAGPSPQPGTNQGQTSSRSSAGTESRLLSECKQRWASEKGQRDHDTQVHVHL